MQHISGESEALLDLIQNRLNAEKDLFANTATCTALLFEGMEAVDWVGLYFLREGELVLGPFQGRATRTRLPLSHPIAGRAIREARTIIIDDLTSLAIDDDEFPARSQIIVPIFLHERIVAILQVDSPFVNRFKENDKNMLERAMSLLLTASITTSLIPKRPLSDARKTPAAPEPPKIIENHIALEELAKPQVALQPANTDLRQPPLPPPNYYTESPVRRRSGYRQKSSPTPAVIVRRIIAVGIALVFFAIALNGAIYESTSPSALAFHVLLRKLYSIIAFALVGFCISLAWRFSIRRTAFSIAGYSASIEIAQAMAGSHEGFISNMIDVFCGGIGGYLGAIALRILRRKINAR